jgi:hypothetical protein
MAPRLDTKCLTDAIQMVGKLIQDPATVVAKQRAPGAIRSITKALERARADIDRNGFVSGTTDFSLTLYAARELERYLCGEKTQICNRRIAEVYYRVLCAGVEQLPRLEQDPNR